MSETMGNLRTKIDRANDLQSVVRTMKALAASNIGQYEKSVSALSDASPNSGTGFELMFPENCTLASSDRRKRAKECTSYWGLSFSVQIRGLWVNLMIQ